MAEEKTEVEAQEKAAGEESTPAESEAAPADPKPPRKKKINQMTLAEVDAKLKQVQEQQGGLESKYARHLQKRKQVLTS